MLPLVYYKINLLDDKTAFKNKYLNCSLLNIIITILTFNRSYPFYWAWLPYAKEPFSEEIKELVLGKISNFDFVQSLITDLFQVFHNDKGFDRGIFEKQMSVMRGQILNLQHALHEGSTPIDLLKMAPITVKRSDLSKAMVFMHKLRAGTPFFTWC